MPDTRDAAPTIRAEVLAGGPTPRRRGRFAAACVIAALALAAIAGPEIVNLRPDPPARSPAPSPGPTGRTSTPATGTPRPVVAPRAPLRPIGIPYVADGSVLVLDAGTVELDGYVGRPGSTVEELVRVRGGVLVVTASGGVRRLLLVPAQGGRPEVIASGTRRVVTDASGRWLAWSEDDESPARHRLRLYDLDRRRSVGSVRLDNAALVHAVTPRAVTFSYAVDPGGSPVRWDLDSGRLTQIVPGDDATPVVVAVRADGAEAVLRRWAGPRPCLLGGSTDRWSARWQRCDLSPVLGTYSPDGRRVALMADTESVEVLDASTGRTVASLPTWEGTQLSWGDDGTTVHLVGDDGLRRCDVAGRRCTTVLTGRRVLLAR